MGKRKKYINLQSELADIQVSQTAQVEGELSERIKNLLGIIRDTPAKYADMFYLIMYDIENNKVRTAIAKYLINAGCVRIQKSVYLARMRPKEFMKIHEDLAEVQAAYENADSILIAPVNTQTLGSMKVIGRNLRIDTLVERPNTLFF